jgi:hypothetical protein
MVLYTRYTPVTGGGATTGYEEGDEEEELYEAEANAGLLDRRQG